MICNFCHKHIKDTENICPYCGNEIEKIVEYEIKNYTIKECLINFLKKGFTSKGVATRKEFFTIFIILVIQNIVLGLIGLNYINTILNFLTFFPIIALTIRRYHDINMSGAFSAIGGISEVSYMFCFFLSGTKRNLAIFLLIICVTTLAIQIYFLSHETNKKSRWNPLNGYLD